ncbi:MAG TPA: 3'-5' exonuclease, partial [Polyangiaceae bacterium]|nr:3'-5' exonuclease [Polyangiaceae bacterium]
SPGRGSKSEKARGLAGLLFFAAELEQNSSACRELIGAIQRRLLETRTRRGGFGFGDLLRVARDALRDHPAIAAAAAASIDTLLVDEFQDTSRVQRDLILLLRERPDSAARRTPGQLPSATDLSPHGLVVVGDRKQSIYGFRGADVSVFAELAAELAGEAAASALELGGVRVSDAPVADFESLKHNYRSGPAILDAVNLIAARDFAERPTRPYEVRYATAEALAAPATRAAGERGVVTLIGDDGGVPESATPIVASATAGLRSAFVAAGFCLHAAAAGAAFREIAVLARRRATLPLVELALDRVGIPYVVSGRALYATREVRDLFAALRLAHDPLDRHALAVVARGLLGGLSDPTLAALCEPRRGLGPVHRWELEAVDEPEQRQAVRLLQERLQDFARVAPRLSPRDALSFAIDLFELENVLAALPRGQVRLGNALRLVEIAARQGGGLQSFVRWLEEQIATEADESEAAVFSEEDDAVRLVTIHGSKGLAFPIVVLLDVAVSEQPRNFPLTLFRGAERSKLVFRQRSQSGALHHPGQRVAYEDQQRRVNAERQRLSYVGITRAERELALVLPPDGAQIKPQTLAATVTRLRQSGELGAIDGVRELDARELLALEPLTAEPTIEAPEPPPRRPTEVRVTALPLAATALGDFALCQRRFELIHVLGLDEPALSGGPALEATTDDPRTLGSVAHRLLERWPLERWGLSTSADDVRSELESEGLERSPATEELAGGLARFLSGAFAARVRRARRVERELELSTLFELAPATSEQRTPRRRAPNPHQLELFSPPRAATEAGTRVLLKTTLDLLVEHDDGSLDIIDYKRSKGRFGERYFLQLSAYKAAVSRHYSAKAVRTGLVHLLGEDAEPHWYEPAALDVTTLATELARARWEERFLPVEKPRCERIGCGFVTTCHRASPTAR